MYKAAKVLVVDDEASIRFFLQETLERDEYQVVAVDSGENALNAARETEFDLALIDLKLQGMDGMCVMRELRRISPGTTIIMLTAHASLETAVEALRQGAHDYLFKPCKTIELRESVVSGLHKRWRELRQRALLTRLERDLSSNLDEIRATVIQEIGGNPAQAFDPLDTNDKRFIQWKGLVVDSARHIITLDGQLLELSPMEFDLLAYLANEAPRVVSPQDLMCEVQGFKSEPWEASDMARYHIYRIRRKISHATGRTNLIHTVRGVGYTLSE